MKAIYVRQSLDKKDSLSIDAQIEDCINCGQCKGKCPYKLDTPALLRKNLEDYKKVLAGEVKVQ